MPDSQSTAQSEESETQLQELRDKVLNEQLKAILYLYNHVKNSHEVGLQWKVEEGIKLEEYHSALGIGPVNFYFCEKCEMLMLAKQFVETVNAAREVISKSQSGT